MVLRLNKRTYSGRGGVELTLFQKMRQDKQSFHARRYKKNKKGLDKETVEHEELSPYMYILEKQGGVCAICKEKDKTGRALAIDHDHKTDQVRGLLCGSCNRGLGLFGDDYKRILIASKYLEKAKNYE